MTTFENVKEALDTKKVIKFQDNQNNTIQITYNKSTAKRYNGEDFIQISRAINIYDDDRYSIFSNIYSTDASFNNAIKRRLKQQA